MLNQTKTSILWQRFDEFGSFLESKNFSSSVWHVRVNYGMITRDVHPPKNMFMEFTTTTTPVNLTALHVGPKNCMLLPGCWPANTIESMKEGREVARNQN